jgi:hypothetical protein
VSTDLPFNSGSRTSLRYKISHHQPCPNFVLSRVQVLQVAITSTYLKFADPFAASALSKRLYSLCYNLKEEGALVIEPVPADIGQQL